MRLYVNPETAAEWVTSLMGIDLEMKGEYLIEKSKAYPLKENSAAQEESKKLK